MTRTEINTAHIAVCAAEEFEALAFEVVMKTAYSPASEDAKAAMWARLEPVKVAAAEARAISRAANLGEAVGAGAAEGALVRAAEGALAMFADMKASGNIMAGFLEDAFRHLLRTDKGAPGSMAHAEWMVS